MFLDVFPTGPIQANCTLLGDDKELVVIDPGEEPERILKVVHEHGLALKHLVLTHGHLDHVCATAAIQRETGAEVSIHEADEMLLDNLSLQATLFGLAAPEPPSIMPPPSHVATMVVAQRPSPKLRPASMNSVVE